MSLLTPFVQLTLLDGTPCLVNINQIVLVESRTSDPGRNTYGFESFTYIVLNGNSGPRDVQESYESVMQTIISYYEYQHGY